MTFLEALHAMLVGKRLRRDRRILTADYTDCTERLFGHKEQEDVENHILAPPPTSARRRARLNVKKKEHAVKSAASAYVPAMMANAIE